MQVVGYQRPDLALLVTSDASPGAVDRLPLDRGARLEYSLGARHCAGTLTDDGHVPCSAPTAPYCEAHASTWVCARCTGTCLKDEMDCYQEHAVYLAAFAPATFKVGVTRLERLETRLREQGADRAAHVHTASNGRIARELEAEIARTLTDRVRVPEKVAGLHRAVDEAAWESLLADFDVVERFEFDYDLPLDDQPIPETLATGTVVGTKGRLLVLERAGSAYAVDARDLVGYELREGASERQLQSSLARF
ncbi:DUF2797 domain-containing protein [Halomarina halobia]|uniref:DUF2797 domain-containing protein n=1 Tax=Halomarina halobia TaxID=3033386 RepID=A0ABD6ACQ0_9EURY|nr:DUF2797 domain-containing protein [Halomarina sp. PSR21]